MLDRNALLTQWVHQQVDDADLLPLSGDASFRRYFRLTASDNTYIVMDAPPEKENAQYFATLARLIERPGVRVPHVVAEDVENGFLVLSDFGDTQLLNVLNEQSADHYYQKAIDALLNWQAVDITRDVTLPHFDETLYHYEFNLLREWFLPKYCQVEVSEDDQTQLEACFQLLMQSAMTQPQVFVHRDYHSRNLMVCDDGELGILDFQDAVMGPVTYDLVSLLRDCYVAWGDEKVTRWARYYFDRAEIKNVSFEQFLKWFDWMGLQRHIKCLGIFSRLAYRDGKTGYLNDMPRVMDYVLQVSEKYPELKWLCEFFRRSPSAVVRG